MGFMIACENPYLEILTNFVQNSWDDMQPKISEAQGNTITNQHYEFFKEYAEIWTNFFGEYKDQQKKAYLAININTVKNLKTWEEARAKTNKYRDVWANTQRQTILKWENQGDETEELLADLKAIGFCLQVRNSTTHRKIEVELDDHERILFHRIPSAFKNIFVRFSDAEFDFAGDAFRSLFDKLITNTRQRVIWAKFQCVLFKYYINKSLRIKDVVEFIRQHGSASSGLNGFEFEDLVGGGIKLEKIGKVLLKIKNEFAWSSKFASEFFEHSAVKSFIEKTRKDESKLPLVLKVELGESGLPNEYAWDLKLVECNLNSGVAKKEGSALSVGDAEKLSVEVCSAISNLPQEDRERVLLQIMPESGMDKKLLFKFIEEWVTHDGVPAVFSNRKILDTTMMRLKRFHSEKLLNLCPPTAANCPQFSSSQGSYYKKIDWKKSASIYMGDFLDTDNDVYEWLEAFGSSPLTLMVSGIDQNKEIWNFDKEMPLKKIMEKLQEHQKISFIDLDIPEVAIAFWQNPFYSDCQRLAGIN